MQTMHPFSEVLYKTDDSPGWNVAILSGESELAQQKAEKLWKKFKIFSGHSSAHEIEDVYPAKLDPEMAHLTSKWIYSKESNKWFFPDEEVPPPASKCEATESVNIGFDFSEYADENDVSELTDLYLETLDFERRDEVQITTVAIVQTDKSTFRWLLRYSDAVHAQIQDFIEGLKNKDYAHIIFEEYEYIKILAWNSCGKLRVKIQDYDFHDEVKEPLDFEVSKTLFIPALQKFLKSIAPIYAEIDAAVREEAKKRGDR